MQKEKGAVKILHKRWYEGNPKRLRELEETREEMKKEDEEEMKKEEKEKKGF